MDMKVLKSIGNSQISSIYLVEIEGEKKLLQVFSIPRLQYYNLYKTIEYSEYIMTNINTLGMAFPSSFMPTVTNLIQDEWYFYQNQYETTLDKYLLKKSIKENQALNIFSQILQSVYSLYDTGFAHRSLRPQHFALHQGKWKLRCLVWSNQNHGIKNQYTFDPQFQTPEEYQAQSEQHLDPCQILVWNLGSILLDMMCGVHFLNSEKIINKFKNKQFSLEAVGCHKNFSQELQNILADMLHFNPEKRMNLETIFSNPYFSKSVTSKFKQQKPKQNQLRKTVQQQNQLVAEKILKQSVLQSSIQKSKAFDIFTSKKLLKIDMNLTKSQLFLSRRQQNQIQDSQDLMDDDEFFDQLKLVTRLQRRPQTILQNPQQNIENDPQIRNILGIYKTMTDRSLLLFISASKISQIPFNDPFKQEFFLLINFSVYYASLIELNRMIRMINLNKNIFHVQEDMFQKFINTNLFSAFQQEINELFVYRQSVFEELAQKLQNLPSKQKNLMKQPIIVQYIRQKNVKQKSFEDIKKPYRLILKKAYDIISALYNQTQNEQFCRLSLYTVFCMTVDKLYIREDLEENFSLFTQWCTSKSTRSLNIGTEKFVCISISQLQKYLENAPIKTLIAHSKKIIKKYFNV